MTRSSHSPNHGGGRRTARASTRFAARLAAALLLLAGLGTGVVVPASSGDQGQPSAIEGTVRDTAGDPLAGASVLVIGTPLSALSRVDGSFRIDGLAAGAYTIEARLAGFRTTKVTGIRVTPGATIRVKICMEREGPVTAAPDMAALEATPPATARKSASIGSARLNSHEGIRALLPQTDNLSVSVGEAVPSSDRERSRPGPASPSPARGGVAPSSTLPPMVPTTGGSRLPNDEPFDSMFFRHYGVNPFVPTDEDSLSTFAMDVDAASYTLARRYLELGRLPDPAAVRVEEFVNYLPQGYPEFEDQDFRIFLEGAPSPFGPGYQLLRVGLKARTISERTRPPLNLTFVIDGSGSMGREDRLGLVQTSLRMLVDRLRDGDRVGIVLFQTEARVILDPVILGAHPRMECESGGHHRGRSPFDKHFDRREDDRCEHGWSPSGRQQVLEAIDRLVAAGSTNAEAGLLLGYDMARRSFRSEASNRVILCSDGVANEGRTGAESILARVRDEADKGIRLTAVGCGMGNYNDVLLEQLADRGDGNYFYVDDLSEARRVLVDGLTGTLFTVAEDAKVQVAFDPARVLRYRLLGFENRDIADRDFRNDRVDAGEVGPGHEVTALYEVKIAPGAREGRLATVRVRYARPHEEGAGREGVREIAAVLDSRQLCRRLESASPSFRLDAAAAEFAEILRGSYWAKESRFADVIPVARRAAEDLQHGAWGEVDGRAADAAGELVTMLEQAGKLEGQSSRNEDD